MLYYFILTDNFSKRQITRDLEISREHPRCRFLRTIAALIVRQISAIRVNKIERRIRLYKMKRITSGKVKGGGTKFIREYQIREGTASRKEKKSSRKFFVD